MPEPKPSHRLVPVADVQRCFSCADTETQLAIATANYHRLRAEVDRLNGLIGRMANRESVHHEIRASTGKGIVYSNDRDARSISELQRRRKA